MRTRTAAVLAVTLLALTGCTSSSAGEAKKPASSKPAASKSATPTPSPSEPMALGDTYHSVREVDGVTYDSTSTVLAYEHDVKTSVSAEDETGADGYVWSALEIKVCMKSDGMSVSRFPWILAYADGARVEPSGTTYGDFPKPEYPIEADVKNGDCVRGKITYAVPGDQRPAKVIYAPDSLPEPVEWTMPKS